MKNKQILLFVIILSLLGQVVQGASPPTVVWQTYGNFSADNLTTSVQVENGGRMLVGNTGGGLLILLDAQGGVVWRYAYNGNGEGYFSGGTQLPNGNFLAVGTTLSGPYGAEDAWVVCVNIADGSVVWQQNLGGTDTDAFNSVCVLADGTIVAVGLSLSDPHLAGHKLSPSFQNGDGWVVWFNLQGNILRDRSYGGDQYDQFTVCKVVNGQLVIGGYSKSGATGNKTSINLGGRDFWFVQVGAVGNILKDKNVGGSFDDALFDLVPTADGGLVGIGYSYSGATGNKTSLSLGGQDGWLVKLDTSWDIAWDRALGGNTTDYLWAGTPTADGGFVVVGGSFSSPTGTINAGWEDGLVAQLDTNGNLQWQTLVGTTSSDEFVGVQVNADGSLFVGGWSWNSPFGGVWLVQFTPTIVALSVTSVTDGNFTAQVTGPHGLYEVQASTNLVDWVTLTSVSINGNGSGSFADPQLPTIPSRFYRAVKVD